MQSQKVAENNGLYFNPKTAKKQYSNEMLMATNKNAKPKSESEKKFDDLFNNKCSWTYKSVKTIKCQSRGENDENGPILKIRTVNIEETAYNRDFPPKNSICLLNGYDNMEADTKKKPNKNMKEPNKLRSDKIVKFDSIKGNRNTSQIQVTSDKNIEMSTSNRNKRNLIPVCYAELDSESIQSSSSDDGLVFLSRGCDGKMINGSQCDSDDNNCDINEIPQEKISKISVESKYNTYDTNDLETSQENSLKKSTEINSLKVSNYQNFKPQSYERINETNNNFDQEGSKTQFQDQNAVKDVQPDGDYQKGSLNLDSVVNRISEKETDLPLSETLSSLSEWDNKFKEKNKPPRKAKNENVSNKNDLDSEIIRQYMTINTEVRSICNELETPNDDKVFNDFFNGNFNLDKYKSKLNTDESASIRKERKKYSSYNSKLLNVTKLNDSLKLHSPNRIRFNGKVKKNNRKSDNAKDTTRKRQESDNKTNSKNKYVSEVRSSTKVKRNYISNFDDYTPLERSDKDEAGNEYPVIDDYFKRNSFNSQEEETRKLNKNKQKRNNSDDITHDVKLEQNATKTNKLQLLDKKNLKLWFPNKYDVTQQPADSKTTKKENISLRSITDGNSSKCAKKTPKTWEDLEADILNREEQISFLPLFESERSPTGEEFLKDEKFHHTGTNQKRSRFNWPWNNFETENAKTQNKWAIVKNDHLASSMNVNDVTFDSPNASIIDRVIRRMQLCTTPVLTPSKVNPQLEEHQKSLIPTEYSYSVQETKSVFLTTEKSLNEKQTGQLKTTWKNAKQKNYRLCKKRQIKTVIDSNGASITNQTSVKLNENHRKKNIRLSKRSESDNESIPVSNNISEIENLTPELEKYLSFPQDLLVPSVDEPYNLRKRKCKDDANRQNTTKKRSIIRANNMTKNNTITQYKKNKAYKQGKRNSVSLIENPTREDISMENFTLNNRKIYKYKSNFINSSEDNADESDSEDLSQNGTLSTVTISYQQDGYLEKSNGNLKKPSISSEEISSQTNDLLASGNAKEPGQSLHKQVFAVKKSLKTNRRKQKLPKRDSKEEYEKYLQKIFSKDITTDSNDQWEFLNGTNETGKNLLGKDNKSYSSTQKLFTETSDEELFSLSSDTDFEQPSPRRASGLLYDVFN